MTEFIEYLIRKNYSVDSIKNFKSEVKGFQNFLSTQNLGTLDDDKIARRFLSNLISKKYKISSIKIKISRLRVYFKFIRTLEKNESVSFEHLILPKKRDKAVFFQFNEIGNMLGSNRKSNDFLSVRNEAIILTFCLTGLRRRELHNLDETDIDFSENTLKIRKGKGMKDRILPLHADLAENLRKYFVEKNTYYNNSALFVSEKGDRLSTDMIYYIVKKIMNEFVQNMPKRSPHVLRHYFASKLHESGADVLDISKLMGHASVVSTETYTHVNLKHLKNTYKNSFPIEVMKYKFN